MLTLKIASAVFIFACGIFGGMLPWWGQSEPKGKRWLGWGIAFSGGVLLSAGFIHLLADANTQFQKLWPHNDYPWAMLLASSSFLLVLFIESVAPRLGRVAIGTSITVQTPRMIEAIKSSNTYPYLLLLTLSVHSILAGLAMGAQSSLSNFAVVFLAIIAHKICVGFALGASLHRIGMERNRARALVAGFAIMTPLGIVTGGLIADVLASHGKVLFEAIFDAVAAGTFVYIATFDVIREEFLPPPPDRMSKWLAAILGLVLMAVVAIWT
ncbi:ZIP family metal transporter [Microbulbifer agarilyticus]|uniref:ZIP family transporter n=1 Tax=Microbulbifer agarilyticus TaxID=260552 RepID=UPI001C989CC0|nr:ZIP family metal transporter [Microbulbifer agarilyticus]MBY6189133.1 ZIP family metal transporter [Microbulbifer agarilyticus]